MDNANLINVNRKQRISENDSFTIERYIQMSLTLPNAVKCVVDVGCNTGRGGPVLRRHFPSAEIIGLDCVPERIDSLDRAIYNKALLGFTTEIPLEDRSVDAIVAGEFLEHVPPHDIDRTLCEFFRVLSLRGCLVMTTPNPCYLRNVLKGWSVLTDRSHLTQHYPDCLKLRLRTVGFSRIKVRGCGKVTRYLGSHFPWLNVYGSYLISAVKW